MRTLQRVIKLVILLQIAASANVDCHEGDANSVWKSEHLSVCSKEGRGKSSKDASLKCYLINDRLIISKLEVLSNQPFLIQYHNLVHRRLCKRAVQQTEQLSLFEQGVAGSSEKKPEKSRHRAANGTWVPHRAYESFAKMYKQLQRNILALDLRSAEHWQVLSYNPHGHYAPHYDYLDPNTNPQLVNRAGNRIATVLIILQTAKIGGTTAFINLGINVRPKIGDVIVWLNILPQGTADHETLHAACPIIEGTKIGATLWVHAYHQELRLKCAADGKHFLRDRFFKPYLDHEDLQVTTKYFD